MKNTIIAILVMFIAGFAGSCESRGGGGTTKAPRVNIHEATFLDNAKAVEQHIAYGSDLNVKDDYGSTPLIIACTFGKTEIALKLIAGGADLEATSVDGSTALHVASFYGRKEIVEALLYQGADPSIRNNYGATAREALLPDFEQVKPVYDQLSRDLGPLGLKVDYDKLKKARPELAALIAQYEK